MATTDTDTTQQRLMRERAKALAILLLTRREGTEVRELDGKDGFHLIATLPPTERGGLRQLGVALRYVFEPVTAVHANRVLQPHWPATNYGPFPFPVILFFFTMRDDGAWFSWVAEPVVSDTGKAQLRLRDEPDCRPLDGEAVEAILDRVDSWYDAHYEGLAAAVPGAKRGKKS